MVQIKTGEPIENCQMNGACLDSEKMLSNRINVILYISALNLFEKNVFRCNRSQSSPVPPFPSPCVLVACFVQCPYLLQSRFYPYPGSWLIDKGSDQSPVPVPAHLLQLTSSATSFKPCQDRHTWPDYHAFCCVTAKPVC